MTQVSPLLIGAFTCNSHITNVTLKNRITRTLMQILKYPYSYLLACYLLPMQVVFIHKNKYVEFSLTCDIIDTYVTKSNKPHI